MPTAADGRHLEVEHFECKIKLFQRELVEIRE